MIEDKGACYKCTAVNLSSCIVHRADTEDSIVPLFPHTQQFTVQRYRAPAQTHIKISSCYTIGLSLRIKVSPDNSLFVTMIVFQWREWKGELALHFDFVYTSLAINSSCFAGFQNSNLICSWFFCSSFARVEPCSEWAGWCGAIFLV